MSFVIGELLERLEGDEPNYGSAAQYAEAHHRDAVKWIRGAAVGRELSPAMVRRIIHLAARLGERWALEVFDDVLRQASAEPELRATVAAALSEWAGHQLVESERGAALMQAADRIPARHRNSIEAALLRALLSDTDMSVRKFALRAARELSQVDPGIGDSLRPSLERCVATELDNRMKKLALSALHANTLSTN